MAYHGSVRCSFCGNVGHNRRTCHYLKEQIKQWEESGDTALIDRAKILRGEPGKPRKCGFCSQPGHTVRTCHEMNAHVTDLAKSWLDTKHFVKKKMFEHNFGIGTLVNVKRRKWQSASYDYECFFELAIVTNIDYNHIIDKVLTTNAYFRQMTPVTYTFVNGSDIGQTRWGRLPRELVDNGYKDDDYYAKSEYEKSANDYVILSPTEASFPDQFLEWDLIWEAAYDYAKGKK